VKLIISGGGTGGHVYPALAAAQSLNRQQGEVGALTEILWIGSVGGMEQALVERAGLTIELITATGLRGKDPVAALRGVWTLGRGYKQSRQVIRRFQPDALFVTGGYVSVPVTLAAWQAGVPVIIYLPDIEPGLAIKFLARFAARVAVTTAETCNFFRPGLTVVTGYPVRAELAAGPVDEAARATARQRLGLGTERPVILVFGGSRGARSINFAVGGQIKSYLEVGQVVHISGRLDENWVRSRRTELSPDLQARYHVWPYLHEEMSSALKAADMVISRAGASVLGEYPAIGLPAILVPYPYAGTHQAANADYLVRHGAAMRIDDTVLERDLKDIALSLIKDHERLRAMSNSSSRLAKRDAADRLAQEIMGVRRRGGN